MASDGSKRDDAFGEAFRLQPPPSQTSSSSSRQPRGRRARQPSVNSQNDPDKPNNEYISNLFRSLNPQNGTLAASTLVPFFRQTRLSDAVLGQIWQLSDKNNKGYLSETEFGLSLRLMALSQKGINPTIAAAEESSLLPIFEKSAAVQEEVATPSLLGGEPSMWSISPQKKETYAALFYDLGPIEEYLDGLKARDSFLKTGVNVEKLAQIWSLADSQERGKLLLEEFLIAMHLIELVKSNKLPSLPAKVPHELKKSAMDAFSDVVTTENQETSSKPPAKQDDSLAITKQQVDKIKEVYMGFPRAPSGDVLAKDCVGYFMNSGLSKDSLAQIWELASYREVDSLNLSEFSIAMILIQNTLNGSPIPSSLPPSLKQYFLENNEVTEVIPKETPFDLSALNVEPIIVQPEFYPSIPFSDKAEDYTPENKEQLSRQLLDIKATYESDQLLIKELETSISLEKLALEDSVNKIRNLISHNNHLQSEQKVTKREADRLADEIEEMKTQCAAMEEEESRLNQLTEKLEKDNRIELSFLEYNIEAATKAHNEYNLLLAQLGEPEAPIPSFLA